MKAHKKLLSIADRKAIAEMVLTPAFQDLMRCASAMADAKLIEKIDEEKLAAQQGKDSLRHEAARKAQEESNRYRAFVEVAIELKKIGSAKEPDYFIVELKPTLE